MKNFAKVQKLKPRFIIFLLNTRFFTHDINDWFN